MSLEAFADEDLVLEVGRGCMPALAELVKRHQERALHVAYRSLGDWQSAEDVVQDGFLRVYRAARRYKPDAKFSTWFYRIIVNLCMDELRKRGRRAGLSCDAAVRAGPSSEDPVQGQAVLELRQAVKRALDQLNERERMAVVLHRFEGLPHGQIAEVMEASVSAVESLLVRAYRKLRRELALFDEGDTKESQGQANTHV